MEGRKHNGADHTADDVPDGYYLRPPSSSSPSLTANRRVTLTALSEEVGKWIHPFRLPPFTKSSMNLESEISEISGRGDNQPTSSAFAASRRC